MIRPGMAGWKGFSLIELLVALSILACVAALIIPRFLGLLTPAKQTVIDNNLMEIQNVANDN